MIRNAVIWWGNLKERNYLDDVSIYIYIYWRIILKYILRKYDGRTCHGLIWHRTGTSGGLL